MEKPLRIIQGEKIDLNNLESSLKLHQESQIGPKAAKAQLMIMDLKRKYETKKVYFVDNIFQINGIGDYYATFNNKGIETDMFLAPEGQGKLAAEHYDIFKAYFEEVNKVK